MLYMYIEAMYTISRDRSAAGSSGDRAGVEVVDAVAVGHRPGHHPAGAHQRAILRTRPAAGDGTVRPAAEPAPAGRLHRARTALRLQTGPGPGAGRPDRAQPPPGRQ